MNRRDRTVIVAAAAVVVSSIVWWAASGASPRRPEALTNTHESTPMTDGVSQIANSIPPANTSAESELSDLEFARVRILLPRPVNRAWTGAVFTSENAFEKNRKAAVVEVLPGWIRKALREGNPDAAAGYLWTLTKLADDEDANISSEAVFAIYRLGDTDGFARSRMSRWIAEGHGFKTLVNGLWGSENVDIRARILREIEFYNDTSFDGLIYDAWERTRSTAGEGVPSVDYAYYLEKHDHQLPDDYWLGRLDGPHGFFEALEIAENKSSPQVTAKIMAMFEMLHTSRTDSIDAGRAAGLASALFNRTSDARYLTYLTKRLGEQLASLSFPDGIERTLDGLARTNDEGAIGLVISATKHENGVISEMAIAALGKSRTPASAEILYDTAIRMAKERKGFPSQEMRALLAQDNRSADSKYERLRQALLTGQIGWVASKSDFDRLEFFRKYGRRLGK